MAPSIVREKVALRPLRVSAAHSKPFGIDVAYRQASMGIAFLSSSIQAPCRVRFSGLPSARSGTSIVKRVPRALVNRCAARLPDETIRERHVPRQPHVRRQAAREHAVPERRVPCRCWEQQRWKKRLLPGRHIHRSAVSRSDVGGGEGHRRRLRPATAGGSSGGERASSRTTSRTGSRCARPIPRTPTRAMGGSSRTPT